MTAPAAGGGRRVVLILVLLAVLMTPAALRPAAGQAGDGESLAVRLAAVTPATAISTVAIYGAVAGRLLPLSNVRLVDKACRQR